MQHLLVKIKRLVQEVVHVGFILKLGLIDLCMECIPTLRQWRVNATFIIVLGLMGAGYFFPLRYKKYLTFYYVILLPIISFLLIYYLNFWR